MLSTDARQRLSKVVAEEESKTSAELVTVVVKSSPDELVEDLSLFLGVGTQVSIVLGVLQGLLCVQYPGVFALIMWLAVVGSCFIVLYTVKKLIKLLQSRSVQLRAMAEYRDCVISKTQGSTGVLLFFSVEEKQLVILADKAIDEKVPADTWERIVKQSIESVKSKDLESGILRALKETGEVCESVVPVKPDDHNEISNDIVVKD